MKWKVKWGQAFEFGEALLWVCCDCVVTGVTGVRPSIFVCLAINVGRGSEMVESGLV